MQVTRIQYKAARKLLRENGKSALHWMTPNVREAMDRLINLQAAIDELQERAGIIEYSKLENWHCDVRQTASRAVLARFEDQRRKAA